MKEKAQGSGTQTFSTGDPLGLKAEGCSLVSPCTGATQEATFATDITADVNTEVNC